MINFIVVAFSGHEELGGLFPQISIGPRKNIAEANGYEVIAIWERKFTPIQLSKIINLAMPFSSRCCTQEFNEFCVQGALLQRRMMLLSFPKKIAMLATTTF